MRQYEALRLAILALLVLVAQLTWYVQYPALRSADLFVAFLLIVSAVRGPLYGGTYAIIGGALMDSFGTHYPVFHLFYYLVAVSVGTLIRSRMLLEYRQLGAAALSALLLLKVVLQFALALGLHLIPGWAYLFRLDNYTPILLECLGAYIWWPSLVRLVPEVVEERGLA